MSSRVLRKLGLQGDKEIPCLNDDASDTEADFSSSTGAKKKQLNKNRYDLLNQTESHSESEVKEDDDHETAGSLNHQDGAIDLKDVSRRKKKRKKKKQSGAKIPNSNTRSSEDNIEDEVERSVREVNEMLGEAGGGGARHSSVLAASPHLHGSTTTSTSTAQGSSASSHLSRGVLSVEHRQLNPNNELRRIFGSKILQNEQVKKRGRNRGHVRSTYLVTPKENWPPIGKNGLSMKLVESKNGLNYFSYEHSLNYQQVQMKFLYAVESLNPDEIVSIINMCPYHVDGLLQLSELSRLSEDLSMAAELVQRALYSLEAAFHPSFSLSSGLSRLDYRKQENRSLYIALFKHTLFVGSRACYRTALELSKLLLSLDETDPLAVILLVDFFALRAGEYDWLVRLAAEWEHTRNLSQLPNFAYSVALAQFHAGDLKSADSSLEEALVKFPGVLLPLMEKCGAQVDSRVSSSSHFSNAKSTQSETLTQLETMYVERCWPAWKDASLLPWLERCSASVLDRLTGSNTNTSPDPLASEWAEARLKRFLSTPRNISRHIILSDLKETHLLLGYTNPVLSYDPLPPLDSIDSYQRPARGVRAGGGARGAQGPLAAFLRGGEEGGVGGGAGGRVEGPLATFFRSIHPNFDLNAPPSTSLGQQLEEGGLRRSVALLLEAMRDLLSNIDLPDVPAEGDVEDGESDDSAH